MKKSIVVGVVFFLLLFVSSASADGWGNYYVKAAGPYETTYASIGQLVLIKLAPVEGGTAVYFRIAADRADKFLAVALTAQSLGAPIRAYIRYLYSNAHWSDYVVTSMFMGNSAGDLN